MVQGNIQPVFILPEGYNRMLGKEAHHTNITAAKAVAETVRTTLGPKGMDKMLVDSLGDVVVTNDGVTILDEMEIEHPAAKMMVEVAKTQEEEVGDGTTTAVVLAGELLKKSEALLEQNIHPTVITKGYRLAAIEAIKILKKMGKEISFDDKKLLKDIALTAMTGKSAETAKDKLAEVIVEAVSQVLEKEDDVIIFNKDNIKVEKKTGGSIDDSELIQGILIDKERIHASMPKRVKNAKILLLGAALEVKETESETKISVTSPEQMQKFLDKEEKTLRKMADDTKESGANVVFCQKGIDDMVQHFLAKDNIFAVRRVKKSDMEKLALATGAKIIMNVKDIDKKELGFAGLVEEKKVAGEDMTFVRNCKNPKAVTILTRGSTEHVLDEVERSIIDAIGDVAAVIETRYAVAGGGAPEIELSKELNDYAETLSGKEQLAVKAFAESMDIIPRTLAENAGLDPIDVMAELKAAHEKGMKWGGLNVFEGKIEDMWKLGVIEPLKIKTQAIFSSSEVAIMILRIDDVIAAGKLKDGGGGMPPMPPGGMGGGMPGMY